MEKKKSDINIDEKYFCSICRNVFIKPHRITSCQHIFCKICIETVVITGKYK